MPPKNGEIYVEFVVQGSVVKVTAIDPNTGREACIVGPAGGSRAALSDAALRKLRFVLQKNNGGT